MTDYYTVRQGDHLSKIAKDNGFTDYTVIWDHPNNSDLKKQRQNPNILLPGDQVFIPDMEQKQESGATDKRHTFTVDNKTLDKFQLSYQQSNASRAAPRWSVSDPLGSKTRGGA